MLFKIIDILHLERRHAYIPDHLPWGYAELYIVRGYYRIGSVRSRMILTQLLVCEFKIILIDKTPVETFPFSIKGTIAIIRQDFVLKVLFHRQWLFQG